MKEVSRRAFLKGALAGTAAVAAVGTLGVPALKAVAEGQAIYTPGTSAPSKRAR